MSFSYASPGSGLSAGGIGWANFGNLTLIPGGAGYNFSGTLNNGVKVTFTAAAQNIAGDPRSFTAVSTPTYSGNALFGSAGYTGILGNVALECSVLSPANNNSVTISNIVVTDPIGNPVPNYTVVMADAESTNLPENWVWQTNGGNWTLFNQLAGSGVGPVPSGQGTQTLTLTGTGGGYATAYLFTTQNPTNLILSTGTRPPGGGRQAIAIGFATTEVTLQKYVGGRIHSSDQFVLDIAGVPNHQTTTAGAATGIQTQFASIYGIPGNTYVINETMAPGSANPLTAYQQVVTAINQSVGGSIPPITALPISFTPVLGDVVTYTILNAEPAAFQKSVDKSFANLGDVLTYTLTVTNPNDFTINNVLVTDLLNPGTTYVGNLAVSVSYTGTTPMSGLILTAIGPHDVATITYQVAVINALPTPNPIVNVATFSVPGGSAGNSNVVTTQVNHADLISTGNFIKSASPVNADVGDVITYTITVHNTGNIPANNVVITDPIPAGTTYVPGSVTGTVAFTGDPTTAITLTAPLAASATATFTFQVKIGATVPATNPIPNTAAIAYTYTVDPNDPDGASATGNSNTVYVQVSNATLITKKSVSEQIAYIGDTLTYSFSITNTGNVPADHVVLTDPVPNGTVYVAGSLAASVPVTGSPLTVITFTNAILPGETVTLSYKVKITAIPNPNPIVNVASVDYAYTVNPQEPDGVTATSVSNPATTVVFRNNYRQQISDLIQSIALQEAALANILQAEGAKMQRLIATPGITPAQLQCLNKSVSDLTDSMTALEAILKLKLNDVDCQICPTCTV